ncbi:hypothetical protein AADZ84_10920 [Colwelliaceae bacterium MEBiC 14330]
MNKHVKLAFFVAPFLTIIGFIGADYYQAAQEDNTKLFALTTDGHCDVVNQSCVLTAGEFKVSVSDNAGVTVLNSTFPIDSAILFLVDQSDNMTSYPLSMKKNRYYWQSNTPLAQLVAKKGDSYKLRLIIKIKGAQYLSEFHTQTLK